MWDVQADSQFTVAEKLLCIAGFPVLFGAVMSSAPNGVKKHITKP